MKESELFVGDHMSACISFPHSCGPGGPKYHIRAERISLKSIFIPTYKPEGSVENRIRKLCLSQAQIRDSLEEELLF